MKIQTVEYLIQKDPFSTSSIWKETLAEIEDAIKKIEYPEKSGGFYFRSDSVGRKRGEGNGVTPIKEAFQKYLNIKGWEVEARIEIAPRRNVGAIDLAKTLPDKSIVAVEWETGNISSSHRSVNKMALGILKEKLIAGVVILPTRNMYKYLTDRIGNFEELSPYFELWRSLHAKNGVLAIIAIEHDGTIDDIPRIPKGTNGRAII
jgi:hypothetical protein